MSVPREVDEYADAKIRALLVKLQRRFEMIMKQMKDSDPATISQRPGTVLPPELVKIRADVKWAMANPNLPKEAKDALKRWSDAQLGTRLPMYNRPMISVEDLMREYLLKDEIEVMEAGGGREEDEDEESEETTSAG